MDSLEIMAKKKKKRDRGRRDKKKIRTSEKGKVEKEDMKTKTTRNVEEEKRLWKIEWEIAVQATTRHGYISVVNGAT